MIDRGKHPVLGVKVDAVDYEAAVERVIAAARERRPFAVTALAVHGVMTGATDPDQRHRLNQLDLVVPDGQPVRWALNRLHGAALPDRVYGPNLMLYLCEKAAQEGLPIFLFGSDEGCLEELEQGLLRRFPSLRIAGRRPSRFRQVTAEEQEEAIEAIRESGAALAFVGLGCPRQEVWVYEQRERLSMPLLAVGAAFDFHAGRLPQAPPRWQRAGLEWLFRLLQEPRRLWRRYVLLNPYFLTLLALQALGLKRIDPEVPAPAEPLRFG